MMNSAHPRPAVTAAETTSRRSRWSGQRGTSGRSRHDTTSTPANALVRTRSSQPALTLTAARSDSAVHATRASAPRTTGSRTIDGSHRRSTRGVPRASPEAPRTMSSACRRGTSVLSCIDASWTRLMPMSTSASQPTTQHVRRHAESVAGTGACQPPPSTPEDRPSSSGWTLRFMGWTLSLMAGFPTGE